jgi:hypothetical protein
MDTDLLDAVLGPILAALGAIGHKALSNVEDETASGLVGLGRRLLARLCHRDAAGKPARPQLEAAAADVAAEPADEDFRAALRGQVRKALAGSDGVEDRALIAQVQSLLKASGAWGSTSGSVVVGHNEGIISTGPGATNTIRRGAT